MTMLDAALSSARQWRVTRPSVASFVGGMSASPHSHQPRGSCGVSGAKRSIRQNTECRAIWMEKCRWNQETVHVGHGVIDTVPGLLGT